MGLVINKPVGRMTLRDVFSRIDIESDAPTAQRTVLSGGPVETERGFVLHRDTSRQAPAPLTIPGGFVLSATRDILEDIARDEGPSEFLFAVGYAGWGPGQLEHEISQNGWLTAPASPELAFGTSPDEIWDAALRSAGIDSKGLSGTAGRA